MTTRELMIIKAVLDYLHALDGGQADELRIHRDIFGAVNPPPSVAELHAVIRECDSKGWIQGVPARFTGKMKWNIKDVGESVRVDRDFSPS